MKIVVVVIVVLVVLALLGLLLTAQRKRAKVKEGERLEQAREHRMRAEEVQLEADRKAGEAQAQGARARQDQLQAERRLDDAEQQRAEAAGLHEHADRLDPDRHATGAPGTADPARGDVMDREGGSDRHPDQQVYPADEHRDSSERVDPRTGNGP